MAKKKNDGMMWGVGALVLLLVGGAAAWWFSRDTEE